MFKSVLILIISSAILTIGACQSDPSSKKEEKDISNDEATLQKSDRGYRRVADDLYIDEEGVIYHRTIDVSAADGNHHEDRGVYTYRSNVFVDTIIKGEETYYIGLISKQIDTASFHRTPDREAYPGYTFYEDQNNFYYSIEVSDGGVLRSSKKK